jgi:hypothetical protein
MIEFLALAALPIGYRLLFGSSPKSLPVKNEDQEMWLLGGGKKNEVAPVNSVEGLWDYKHSITSNAIAQGRRVEMDLRSFDKSGNPFVLNTKFN